MDLTEKIVTHLREKYNPEVIILEGSRAAGAHRSNSDWDFYIFVTNQNYKNGREEFDGESLDINFIELPVAEDFILENFYGPLNYTTVLLDNPNRLGEAVINRTRLARQKPRPALSDQDYFNRKVRLRTTVDKIAGSTATPEVCFYYVALLYELVLRYWFEIHQEWTLHPREAIVFVQEKDPAFYNLLHHLIFEENWDEKATISADIYHALFHKT